MRGGAGCRVAIGSERHGLTAIGVEQYLLADPPQHISAAEGSDAGGWQVELSPGRGAFDLGNERENPRLTGRRKAVAGDVFDDQRLAGRTVNERFSPSVPGGIAPFKFV